MYVQGNVTCLVLYYQSWQRTGDLSLHSTYMYIYIYMYMYMYVYIYMYMYINHQVQGKITSVATIGMSAVGTSDNAATNE